MWKRDNSGGGTHFLWLLQERHAFLSKIRHHEIVFHAMLFEIAVTYNNEYGTN